VRPFQQ